MKYYTARILVLSAMLCACTAVTRGGEGLSTEDSTTGGLRHQRQRRAMGNRRRHNYNNNYPNRYSLQEEQDNQKKHKQKTRQTEASLADVWLCYAFALGWSMWFLSSFLNTDLMRFAESDSVLVHGNVREVSIEDDSLGTGIPTYNALIDYIITVRRKADTARIQVRKSFQTQHLLQQGFANVELLVLPEEPTSSVLKEDWQREVAAQEQAEEDIISIGGFGDMGVVLPGVTTVAGNTGTTEKGANDRDRKPGATLSRVDVWAKRTSLILSGILVTASLIGAVQTVHRIPSEGAALLGWISVVVGSVLLWPLAMAMLRLISCIQHLGRLPSEKTGIILKCDTNAQVGATINEEKMYTQHQDKVANKGNVSARHLDRVEHPGVFEKLKNPKLQEGSSSEELENSDSAGGIVQDQQLNASGDESACYFVKLPGQKDASGMVVRLDDSSLSTISANSHLSRNNRNSVSST